MNDLKNLIPESWRGFLGEALESAEFVELSSFLEDEWRNGEVFPLKERIFTALSLTPPEKTRVIVIGQDPYHDDGQAQGLAFSVPCGMRFPPSLRNIFKELTDDIGCEQPISGDLTRWAHQGVLLINAVLTVHAHQANSHAGKGWEAFTDAILARLSERDHPLVFLLWGGFAAKKESLVDTKRHTVLKAPHPSPLSAHKGFLGSKPFSKINGILTSRGESPIDWSLDGETDVFNDLPLFSNDSGDC